MSYSNVTVYYTSGTGSSFRAATWLTDVFFKDDATTQLVPVDSAPCQKQLVSGKTQLVGLYHPAHGLMPPWSMIKFLLFHLPWGNGAHGMVVSTQGGIPNPKVVIPGGGGLALFFPLLILVLTGYRVRGALGLNMPRNLLNVHQTVSSPISCARAKNLVTGKMQSNKNQ